MIRPPETTKKDVLTIVLLIVGVALTVIAYLPSLKAGFYFDDLFNFVEVSALHWDELSLANTVEAIRSALLKRRVVANLTFGLNHRFGGLDPWGYHAVNLLIHLATGAVLGWVAWLLALEPPRRQNSSRVALRMAVASTIVFLVHPINIQAVTYVVQRMSSLAALFSLLSLGFYIQGRRGIPAQRAWLSFLLAFVSWLAALGSKENALVLPAVAVAYELCFRRGDWGMWIERLAAHPKRRLLQAGVAAAAVVLIGLMVAYVGKPALSLNEAFPNRDFNSMERMLTQARVQLFYLSLVLWPAPSRLNLDHEFEISRSLLSPSSTLAAVVFWIAVVIGAYLLVRWRPNYGFPVVAYLLLHTIESGPINLELVFEHRMYLPMAALVILMTAALVGASPRARTSMLSALLVAAIPLTVATYHRNQTWSDPVAFHLDTASKSPNKFRPQYNLGTELGKLGRCFAAIPVLKKAIEIEPDKSEPHTQLGNCYLYINLPDKAFDEYREAVSLDPNNAEAVYNLAFIFDSRGQHSNAVENYRRFLEIPRSDLTEAREKARLRLIELVAVREGEGHTATDRVE